MKSEQFKRSAHKIIQFLESAILSINTVDASLHPQLLKGENGGPPIGGPFFSILPGTIAGAITEDATGKS